jgi:uncharacterized protein (TIGR02001 family)
MNKFTLTSLTTLAVMSSLLSTPALAVEGLSATIAASSNYLWRGVTQTQNGAAISGGIDYSASSGFYAGTWVSNVDFGDDASYEVDFYFGFSGQIDDKTSYDVGYIYYGYPDSDQVDSTNEYDFGEIYGKLTYNQFTLGANYGIHNDDAAAWADKALYLTLDGDFEVADGLNLNVHIGQYKFDIADAEDYVDYGVSLSKSGFTFGISDTDLANDDIKFYVAYAVDFDL